MVDMHEVATASPVSPRRRRRAVLAAVALLLVGAGLAASARARHGAGAAEQGPRAPSIIRPALVQAASLHLPVESYMLADADLTLVARARARLVERCLDGFGIHLAMPDPGASSAFGPRTLMDRRYGITDAHLAAVDGFGLGPRDPSLAPPQPKPDLSVDARTALSGQGASVVNGKQVPRGGCLTQADRQLDAGNPANVDTALPQRLQFATFEQSQHDPTVLAAISAWSSCMQAAGYRYASPLDAVSDPRFTDSTHPSRQEIRTAVADVRCKERTNLVGIWFSTESAMQRQEIARSSDAFASALRALRSRVDRARIVVQP